MYHGLGDPGRGRRERPIRTGRRDRPVIQLPSVALRVAIMAGMALVLFSIILFRLWFLQILSGDAFIAQANDNRLRTVKIVAPRGFIRDRNGKIIVENRPGLAVGIRIADVPKPAVDSAGVVAPGPTPLDTDVDQLARILRMRPAKIRREIMDHMRPSWPLNPGTTRDTRAAWEKDHGMTWSRIAHGQGVALDLAIIKEDVSRKVVSYILEHTTSLPGVETPTNSLRAYPRGAFATQLLGHIGEISGGSGGELSSKHFKGYSAGDIVGKDGLEWTYDRWLRGRDGSAKIEVDASGRPKSHEPIAGGRLPEPGDTLITTLDVNTQTAAERALVYGIDMARKKGNYGANGAAAVVLDAHSGEVLAMASYPTYDPNLWVGGMSAKDYRKLGGKAAKRANYPLLNRVIQESKAVGSTFKSVTATAGLEEGVIQPYSTFTCTGSYIAPDTLDKQVFHCWDLLGHGTLNLIQAITQSCDIYFYNVGYQFYLQKGSELADWATRMGMGRPTGIDLPGEVPGRVPTPAWKKQYFKTAVDKLWNPGDSIQMAVGQGFMEATPLQLAVTYATIANGGTVVTPHLGKKIVDAQGKMVRDLRPGPARHVDISQSTLDAVRTGLREAASSPVGTSSSIFGAYPVAVAGKTGTAEVYDASVMHNVNYAWYASYAPASDPKYVTVVMIEKGGHGGDSAAPATRMIYDQLFHLKSGLATSTAPSD